jgi:Zn-dependent protease/predicted transcriptional regulator
VGTRGAGTLPSMFGRSFRIARVGGIPVNVDASWIYIAVLGVYWLYVRFEGRLDVTSTAAFGYAVLGAVLFFGSVFLHELAHAVTARISGIHVEGITLVFFGGFTSARSEQKGAWRSFAISAMGPATTLVVAAVLLAAAAVVDGDTPLPRLLEIVGRINLFMAGFNALPGLPLDGGRMLQAAVWGVTRNRDRGIVVASYGGMAVGVAMFGLALLAVSRQQLFDAIWVGLLGSFIFQGARSARERITIDRRLEGATVVDVMEPPPTVVPADLSLSETLDRYLRGHEDQAFPVVQDGLVIGMVSFASARDLGSVDPLRPAREAMIPLGDVVTLSVDDPIEQVISRVGTQRAALVLDQGRLVGAVTPSSVYRFASRRG